MINSTAKHEDIVSDLFMALLAVNSWTLERVGRLYPTLQENGLFDVRALSGLDPEQIEERLSAAGYRRGPVLGAMMALRVQHVALALANGGAQLLAEYEAARDMAAARKYLLKLKGVGPAVVESYLSLRSSARS
jgi:endonuclease III-like uncharacterized protein